jgi:hypothetical protein
MGSGGNGGPHDKPGSYEVIPLSADPQTNKAAFDSAEANGYTWVDMNGSFAVFYKKG